VLTFVEKFFVQWVIKRYALVPVASSGLAARCRRVWFPSGPQPENVDPVKPHGMVCFDFDDTFITG
jgi:hypothetical protein